MLSEKALMAINDIAKYINLAMEFTKGMTLTDFVDDQKANLAVQRCLTVISEASRRLPDTLKEQYPQIAWKNIASAGNIYRHEYHNVNDDTVWDTVQNHLPSLLTATGSMNKQSG